ncbi:MAG: hypothetical protein WC552_09495 [Candidatus Omnitrophota bacterium]
MTKSFPLLTSRSVALKAILISFLLHFFFLETTVFTFSVRSVSPNPLFVFLGSILQKSDLVSAPAPRRGQALPSVFNSSLNVAGDSDSRRQEELLQEKPSYSDSLDAKGKIYSKSIPYGQAEIPPEEKDKEKILGIDLTPPKRIPLKLLQK